MSDKPESAAESEGLPAGDLGLERFRDYLRSVARANLGKEQFDGGGYSDVVQQTLYEAHRDRTKFRGNSDRELAGWLSRILTFKIADLWRARRRAERRGPRRSLDQPVGGGSDPSPPIEPIAPQSSVGRSLESEERAEHLRRALESLPESQRRAVVLRHYEGKSLAEIAEILGKSQAAVAGLIKRGLAELKSKLTDLEK
jgi:RNA polymerase sigma-70 factor (ECF subfamily)